MTRASPATLFSPLRLGAFTLAHRVVMPAMARGRASAAGVPTAMMARYYGARATPGGMIICEACAVSADGLRPHAPGLFTAEQVNHWQQVTRAVHDQGGIVLAQLDHGGSWTQDGDMRRHDDTALESAVLAYRNAAENAGDAGFDGVELLVAHGALPERVRLHDGAVHEHADRFLGTLTGTLANVWGSDRVGVCLSPGATEPDGSPAWLADCTRTVDALHREPVAFLHVIDTPSDTLAAARASALLRAAKPEGMLVSGGHSRDTAMAGVAQGDADAIGFGRAFIANPDLVDRLRDGAALNALDLATLHDGGERGYLDYPLR